MVLKNFVVFEGVDGSGTTTQLRLLEEKFSAVKRSADIVCTAEPTSAAIGVLIRTALNRSCSLHPKTIAYLFGADRCEHVYGSGGIKEQLAAGKAVFCDRYLFSSLAYQGLTAGDTHFSGDSLVTEINGHFPLPAYLFFFELPIATAMQRVAQRKMVREIYEKSTFQEQVARKYNEVISVYEKKVPDMQVIRMNAAHSIQKIHKKIWSIVKNLPIV